MRHGGRPWVCTAGNEYLWRDVKRPTKTLVCRGRHPQVETSLPDEALAGDGTALPPGAALTLSAPGVPPVKVPLVRPEGYKELP